MLSRVAESLYWMSRYMERAENTASFLDVNFHLMLDLNKLTAGGAKNYWEPLIHVTCDTTRFRKFYHRYTAETVTDFLVFNRENPNSIRSCIALARENARSTIESISSEMWESLNNLYHDLERADPKRVRVDAYSFYRDVKMGTQLFQGITEATLLRNEGHDFMQMGKYLERADNVARLVDTKYHMLWPRSDDRFGSVDVLQWMAVLKSCSALEAYRKMYHAKIEPDSILGFLVLDRLFPRSVLFSVVEAQEAMYRVSGSRRGRALVSCDRLVGMLEAEMSYTAIDDIYARGLHDYLVDLELNLSAIGSQVHQTYFAYRIADPETAERQERAKRNGSKPRHTGQATRAMWRDAEQQQQQQQQ
jgi:uncharacterized alpha-E superfamily protein